MRKHIFCSTWNLHLEALEPVGRECDECSPFIWTESSDRSLTKLYGNGFFLSMLSSKHFQTNSSGVPSLWVTAKRILSLCSIFCLSRFIFLRSPSCNFTQADCLEWMAQTVAFHWWGPQDLRKLLLHGRKATFREATFRLPNRGSGEKNVKNPNLPTNCPHHLGALVVIVCQTSTKYACRSVAFDTSTHGIRDQDQGLITSDHSKKYR